MIGDFLYQLQGNRDLSAAVLQRTLPGPNSATVLSASVLLTSSLSCPLDKVCLVEQMFLEAFGGGAQTVSRIGIEIIDTATLTTFSRVFGENVAALASRGISHQPGRVLLLPGESLRFFASFSAGAVANELNVGWCAYFMPKGNVQLR